MLLNYIARDLADLYADCENLGALFAVAHNVADNNNVNLVLCIGNDGVNYSQAFHVAEYSSLDVERYFEKECPLASACSFKLHIWAC